MNKLFLLLFTIFSIHYLHSQSTNELDKVLKIEDLKFNKNEIRVYKRFALASGVELFRFYMDDSGNWKAEFYETIDISENREDELVIDKITLNPLKNPKLVWLQILDTSVIYLPQWKAFTYKLKKNLHDYNIIEDEITSSIQTTHILDGISYYVKIKNEKNENEFSYSNPEDYLKIYPNVDELISFKELLDLLRNDFKIFLK